MTATAQLTSTEQSACRTHPFERHGLGIAPFRVVGCEERRGPIMIEKGGSTLMIGAPGQPMGCCDYCGTGIAMCWTIESADGRTFIVGSDCVAKTQDRALTREITRQTGRARKSAEGKRVNAMRTRLADDTDLRSSLATIPSPNISFRPGETALDWADWMMRCAGHSGRMKVVRMIEKAGLAVAQ